jgi:hypothetical protein
MALFAGASKPPFYSRQIYVAAWKKFQMRRAAVEPLRFFVGSKGNQLRDIVFKYW